MRKVTKSLATLLAIVLCQLSFAQSEVLVSGTVTFPSNFTDNWDVRLFKLDGSDGYGGYWADVDSNANTFQVSVPPGKYSVSVSAQGFYVGEQYAGGEGYYSSSTSVDASSGDVSNVNIPAASVYGPVFSINPPVASLISVGEVNESGIATITGSAGAVDGLSSIGLVHLQTGQYRFGVSNSDGSFAITMFAPQGSYLAIHQDKTGQMVFAQTASLAAGTIIRVPVVGEEFGAFATGAKIGWNGKFDSVRVPIDGGVDVGQIWLSGTLDSRNWSAGQSGSLSGSVKIYSRNISNHTPTLNGTDVFLERIFDGNGKQEIASPEQASHFLTPTGFPLERRNSDDPVSIGRLTLSGFNQTSDRSGEASWELNYQVPGNLPAGTYQLVLASDGTDANDPMVSGLEQDTLYYEDVYPVISDLLFSTGAATLVDVSASTAPRLSWALGLNTMSNGSRGTVALEDRDRLGIAGHVKTNSSAFIVPRVNELTGEEEVYRLEPFAPLVAAGNRGWISPPTIPFDFSSSSLSVSITRPDGSMQNLGTAAIAQPFVQEWSGRSGQLVAGNHPRQHYGLTTLDADYDVTFQQYGLHTVSMTGYVDDIFGTRYQAGGTYEIYVAKTLDLEFGVFPSTPFEVGDVFSPSVIVQPGIPADVEVRVSHYPNSEPALKTERVISGAANRFGYFSPTNSQDISMASPGEYRVDYTVSYSDPEGVLWMGSRSWGSVVATPNSDLITRGRRGSDSLDLSERQQWFNMRDISGFNNHIHFPFQSGDVIWMEDTHTEPDHIAMMFGTTIQDTGGTYYNLIEQRVPQWPLYPSVANSNDQSIRISIGEAPLFSSSSTALSPLLIPDAPDNYWGYFYSGAARPGVSARELVLEDDTGNSYWRFDDKYSYQLGNGANGDQPNDFKFFFSGAVFRAPSEDFYYYGAYGSTWVMLPHNDAIGGRTFPPFQGAAGGPSGGPIMTLLGQDIDMFLHPLGVRAGSILELGDIASFSGQVAPTLASDVDLIITSPSGVVRTISGQANKVGYYYDSTADFMVDETGVYTVDVTVTHTGNTSAGMVDAPYPTGSVLGSDNGSYEFYVVSRSTPILETSLVKESIVHPADSAISLPFSMPAGLSNVQLHHTTVMPGFILDQGQGSGLSYSYNATALAEDFPNLDLYDVDYRAGADTVTLSFLLSGTNSEGNLEHHARQILLQGESLLVLDPPAPTSGDASWTMENQTISEGDALKVDLTVDGSGSVDIYVALLLPSGDFFTLGNPLSLSAPNAIIPFKLAEDVTAAKDYSVVDLPLPADVAAGVYTFYAITVKAGDNLFVESNWLSVETLPFTIE